VSWRYSTGN